MIYLVEESIPAHLLPNEPFTLRVSPIDMEQVKRLIDLYEWRRLMDYKKLKRLLMLMFEREVPTISGDIEDKLKNYDKIIMFVFNECESPKQSEIFPIPRKILLMQIEFFFQEHPCDENFRIPIYEE